MKYWDIAIIVIALITLVLGGVQMASPFLALPFVASIIAFAGILGLIARAVTASTPTMLVMLAYATALGTAALCWGQSFSPSLLFTAVLVSALIVFSHAFMFRTLFLLSSGEEAKA